MDAVSYSHADNQKKKIDLFTTNPNSSSGLITNPLAIDAGETVTIPAGRQVIISNLEVDATAELIIDGEVGVIGGGSLSQVKMITDNVESIDGLYSFSVVDIANGLTLPDITGQDGKFLYTNGTINSWEGDVVQAPLGVLPILDGSNLTGVSGVTDHTLLSNIGTKTHSDIDFHIADSSTHYTMASISITESQISDLGTYETADADIVKAPLGVLPILDGTNLTNVGVSDHTQLSNIGTKAHSVIDTHIDAGSIHFDMASIGITESQVTDLGTYEPADADLVKAPLGVLPILDGSNLTGIEGGSAQVPVGQGIMNSFEFTSADGQTVFSGGDKYGTTLALEGTNVTVFVNGFNILLDEFSYDGTSVTLVTGVDINIPVLIYNFILNGPGIGTKSTLPAATLDLFNSIVFEVGNKPYICTANSDAPVLDSDCFWVALL